MIGVRKRMMWQRCFPLASEYRPVPRLVETLGRFLSFTDQIIYSLREYRGPSVTDFASFPRQQPREHPLRSSNENVGRKSRAE